MSAVLDGIGVQELARPGLLLVLLLLVAVGCVLRARARPAALEWAALAEARVAGARRFDPVRAAGGILRAGGLCALALVLAGPMSVHRAPPEPGFGLDITLVVDASGSMRALDAQVDGKWATRLDLARAVVARFASRRAAEGDRVALVVFGTHAFTQCPLTSDGAVLSAALARVKAGMAGESTALGQALALAVKRALGADTAGEPAEATRAGAQAGRVVVLLTDGRHNAGPISLEQATRLAASAGVRVHTVAIGSEDEEVPVAGRGGVLHLERHDVDVAALQRIARATGGRFFRARRSSDLHAVYRDIDALERVPRTHPPRIRHSDRPEPLLALAGGLLVCEIALARVLRRRLP